jgi:hypothetical protein
MYYNKLVDAKVDYECTFALPTYKRDCTDIKNPETEIKNGSMPFRSGYKRTLPTLNERLYPSTIQTGTPNYGLLPYYFKCTYASPFNDRSIYPLSTVSRASDWDDDCNPAYTLECASNYFAVKQPGNGDYLVQCVQCAAHGFSAGGLVDRCTCNSGYANLKTLLEQEEWYKSPSIPTAYLKYIPTPGAVCLNCNTEVRFVHDPNIEPYVERLVCVSGREPKRCTDTVWSVVNKDGTACDVCMNSNTPANVCPTNNYIDDKQIRHFPDKTRANCITCPNGTRIVDSNFGYHECQACAFGQFQANEGRCHCKAKRSECKPGERLNLTDHLMNSRTEDLPCVPCEIECDADAITVFSDETDMETNASARCDGKGRSYFACYSTTNYQNLGLDAFLGFRLDYIHNPNTKSTAAILQRCDPALLPNNATFVAHRTGTAVGVECYFACTYGVNPARATQYHAAIRGYVHTTPYKWRLRPFLLDGPVTSIATTKSDVFLPDMWGHPSIIDDALPSRTSRWTVDRKWTITSSFGALLDNTFLFDAAFLKDQERNGNTSFQQSLCEPPANVFEACGVSMYYDAPAELPPCALYARTRQYTVSHTPKTGPPNTQAVVLSPEGFPICTAFIQQPYQRYRTGCKRACLDAHMDQIEEALYRLPMSLLTPHGWYLRLIWTRAFSASNFWQALYGGTAQPYLLYDTCNFTCVRTSTMRTFRYDPIQDHNEGLPSGLVGVDSLAVCVPCGDVGDYLLYGNGICGLFNPPRNFDPAPCMVASTEPLFAKDVCSNCSLTVANGRLINRIIEPDLYKQWAQLRDLDPEWGRITCRYKCNQGYANNPFANTYNDLPCISCTDNATFVCPNFGIAKYWPKRMDCDANNNNINYYVPCNDAQVCSESDAYEKKPFVFQSQADGKPVVNHTNCRARCNATTHQTLDARHPNKVLTNLNEYIPAPYVRCVSCAEANTNYACNGTCPEGHYRVDGVACRPCNTSRCEAPGHYRALCVAGQAFADAPCLPRPPDFPLLYEQNDPQIPRRQWLAESDLEGDRPHLRWVAAVRSPYPKQVAIACVNNYVWRSRSSGLAPVHLHNGTLLSDDLECVPCAAPVPYSVWNASNASSSHAISDPSTEDPFLRSTAGLYGGCYACDTIARDVVRTSTALCELQIGYTADGQSNTFTTVFVNVIIPTNAAIKKFTLKFKDTTNRIPMTGPSFNSSNASAGGGARRRMLSTSAPSFDALQLNFEVAVSSPSSSSSTAVARPIQERLPMRRVPVMANGEYFACCDTIKDDDLKAAECRALKRFRGQVALNSPCGADEAGGGRRRLLSSSSLDVSVQPCPVGMYKPTRGEGICVFCAVGASTSYVASGASAQCACVPGFYFNASVDGGCHPCPPNTYRAPTALSSSCQPCPANQGTQGLEGATQCECEPGTYMSALNCTACPMDHYCLEGRKHACPANARAPPGSARRDACQCALKEGFYGPAGGTCYPRPIGLNVSGTCARGWRQRAEFDPHNNNAVWIRCESDCGPGQYARVEPGTQALRGCASCPVDTYAVDGTLVEACTPCPKNMGTAGRIGSTSPANCTCVGGVMNQATCAGCDANTYYDPIQRVCLACPVGTGAPPNAIGLQACRCLPGTYAAGDGCLPCPLGSFSHSIGLACTLCPPGCTTAEVGQTAYAACYCPSF